MEMNEKVGCELVYLVYDGENWKESRKSLYDCCLEEDRRILYASPVGASEPASSQFQDADGSWHHFCNESHRVETIKAGYPVRDLFTGPQPQQPDNRDAAESGRKMDAQTIAELSEKCIARDALIAELQLDVKQLDGTVHLLVKQRDNLQARLAAAEKGAAQLQREALGAFKSLLAWRKRSWPDTNQEEVMATSFPTIAAIAAGEESHD